MAISIFQVCRDDCKWLFANLDEESSDLMSGVVCDELSEWEQLPRRADIICASGHAHARFLQSFMTKWLWGQNIDSKSQQFLETEFQVLLYIYIPNWHSRYKAIDMIGHKNVRFVNRPYQYLFFQAVE